MKDDVAISIEPSDDCEAAVRLQPLHNLQYNRLCILFLSHVLPYDGIGVSIGAYFGYIPSVILKKISFTRTLKYCPT